MPRGSKAKAAPPKRPLSPAAADADADAPDELSEPSPPAPPAVPAPQPEKRRRTGDGADKPADQKDRRKSVWQAEQDGDFMFTKKVTGQPKTSDGGSNENVKPADKEPRKSSKSSAAASKAPEPSAAETATPVKPTMPRIEKTIDVSDISVSSFSATLPAQTRDAIMPMPVRDTPAINRNKEMRNKNPNGPRRSSLGSRGRRSSTALHGLCHIPHPDVSPSDFYRHIQDDLSEPQKMKQLLAWCAERAMSAPPRRNRKDALAADLSQIRTELQNDFIEAIRSGKVDCSWWKRKKDPRDERTSVTKPNPRNIENQKTLSKLEQTLQRLQKEEEMWTELMKERNSQHAAAVDSVPSTSSTRTVDPVVTQAKLVQQLDEEQRRLLEHGEASDTQDPGNGIREALRELSSEQVERMFRDVYRLTVMEDVTRRYNDDLHSKLVKAYDLRNRLAEPAPDPEPMQLLRALSQVPAS